MELVDSGSASEAPKASQPTKTPIQNGKGDAPRNVGTRYAQNYDEIDWGRTKENKNEP